ncbi:DUF6090 family protein [Algoriphagus namhaensis]|uniref:DUF6090 family protein n=1 Tax=Algoriphagus namhaensis TaxID=915353 RepID=A0ABV8ASP7_9BACT
MLQQNQVTRYLLYALGEIILVMIGILLALQVNTWNEQRKSKALEQKTLRQLNADLRQNYSEIKSIRDGVEIEIEAGEKILHYLETEEPVTDSLLTWIQDLLASGIFNNANTTYTNLQNGDGNLISNDSLRLRITLMYEEDFTNIFNREERLYTDYLPKLREESLTKFKPGPMLNKPPDSPRDFILSTPTNYSLLRKDQYFKNVIFELTNFRKLRLRFLNETLIDLEKLIDDINQEHSR